MSEYQRLIDELDRTLPFSDAERRIQLLQRISDLFVAGSSHFADQHVALFDDVLLRLTADIEVQTRAKLARRLADVENAPPILIRTLAFDDAIAVAAPVLSASPQLTEADLAENAALKSQDHLYAIAQRPALSEAVTDVLVTRGDQRVLRSTARNQGARFSRFGFERLVAHAQSDARLALTVGRRGDIPRPCFLKLLETASAAVRDRLMDALPPAAGAITEAVDEVALAMRRQTRESSQQHAAAMREASQRFKTHGITEADVHAPARAQDFDRAVIALSTLGGIAVDIIERALLDHGADMVLTVARAAGCTWATAKALLLMHAANRGMSADDLERAHAAFDRLRPATAKRVLKFHERRASLRVTADATADAPPLQPA